MSEPGGLLETLAGDDEWARHSTLQRLRAEGLPGSELDPIRTALADEDDPTHRAAARMAVAALASPESPDRERAVDLLREALRAPDVDLRVMAAVAMGESGNPEAAAALVAALDDPDANVAAAAAEALGALGHAGAIGPLAAVASRGGFWVRAAAVGALGHIRDPRAIPALAAAAELPELHGPVVEALRAIDHPEALPVLETLHGAGEDQALLAAGAILAAHPRTRPPAWIGDAARAAEPRLREVLEEHDDPAAARLLGLAGTDSALHLLVDLVGPPRQSEAALTGLLAVDDDRRADAILPRLPDAGTEECVALLSLLPPVGTEARIRPLLPLLDDPDPAIRAAAAESLARAPTDKALPLLSAHLNRKAPSPEVLRAMGNLGETVCHAILPLLDDDSAPVRTAAAEALARCAAGDVVDELMAALDREEEPSVRSALLRAYGRAQRSGAVPRLSAALGDPDEGVRLAAIEGLGTTGDAAALPHLEERLQGSPAESLAALRAMGDVGHPDAVPILEPWFDAPDLDARRTAAGAAVHVASALSRAGVQRLSRDEDEWVRICAARILGHRGGDGERLGELAATDPSPAVRNEARRILDREG